MHKISLKDWVVLLTILPTLLIGLCLGGYFSYNRYVELNDFLTERSNSIIEPLAIASVDLILSRDREKLRNLIGFAHRSQSSIVKNIAVFTEDNQVFVTSSYNGDINLLRLKAGESLPLLTTRENINDSLIFRTPIILESVTHDNGNVQTPEPSKVGYIAMHIDSEKIKFNQQSQALVAFAIVLLGGLISALFATRLIKNVTRPISSMVQAVDRIREGKKESRVSGQLIGELNFLKNGINAMAQSLGDYQEEMQRSIDQATIDLRESLEQFEIQNVELDISKRRALEANKVKSEFLANMSHELRTPLNGVLGFARQLLKTPLSETQRDYLQTIERSANNLLAIINDILDFSKLDAGKMVIENMPFSLRESVEESLTLLAPLSHKKGVELSYRIAPALPDAYLGDAMRIKQVITNLTNNAIKFTKEGSVNIDVDSEYIEHQHALIKVTVRDTGVGMSQEQQSSIFEAFGQADKSITRLYGGTGLGLVISQRLAHEMNGNIGFSSEQGVGSTFWFTFLVDLNAIPMIASPNNEALDDKNILYFEPHQHARISTTEILTGWGMNVYPVADLAQLSELIVEDNRFDYALIGQDVKPSTLSSLKNLIVTIKPIIPSIHIAVNNNSPSLQEALIASGALSCISKPITPTKLTKSLLPQQFIASQVNEQLAHQKANIKVLAVDDNEANLKLINALLLEQVAEVITATNGQEAVNLCKNEKFAIIFMDIQMPIMDGITALKTIKSSTFNDETPIIAVTAHVLGEEKESLLQDGFNSFMTKPIDESMLKHTIYEYCDVDLLSPDKEFNESKPDDKQAPSFSALLTIDWGLALKRAGNKEDLAKEMLIGLVKDLPDMQEAINKAIKHNDIDTLKTTMHKLNGACCYTGVPHLARITNEIESSLKTGTRPESLEPEFYEFFEQVEKVLEVSKATLEELRE